MRFIKLKSVYLTKLRKDAPQTVSAWLSAAEASNTHGVYIPTAFIELQKGKSVSTFVFEWYDLGYDEKEADMITILAQFRSKNNLFSDEVVKSEKNKEYSINGALRRLRLSMELIRCFLFPEEVIPARPPNGNTTALQGWQDHVRRLSEVVVTRARRFCNQHAHKYLLHHHQQAGKVGKLSALGEREKYSAVTSSLTGIENFTMHS